ncbi:hypothetical protein SmJEL517_g00606 [Synchytrium microbalum]|uniref:VPS37 C-terminal domain-containing protein n=1 Tax=Synchytrium microbalum TaxID=1806994 RepID=A0A507CEG4_9FUNG|nr:uncharacterized protein SmJEL517_g00606 [Synchytrium microbalum]TPX37748.1 hypothetical protein SmJEL517_g00606 [Synchytrium microbalum]
MASSIANLMKRAASPLVPQNTGSNASIWSNNSNSSSTSSTAMQDLRRKQIASLREHGLTVRELTKDTNFEILATLSSTLTVFLVITLPPQFPDKPPVIQIRPPPAVSHAWIDSRTGQVVGHDKLTSGWNQHVSLGKLVKDIIQEFQIRNPVVIAGQGVAVDPRAQPYTPAQPLSISSSLAQNPSYYTPPPPDPHPPSQQQQQLQQQQQYDSSEYAKLDTMTADELEVLISNETAFQTFVDGLPQMREAKTVEQNLRMENEALARKNLDRHAELEEKRTSLREKQQALKKKREAFDALMAKQQDELFRFTPEYLTMQLREAANESDSLSESMADAFREGRVTVDDFLRQYRETRKVYHIRNSKHEKVLRQPELLQAGSQQQSPQQQQSQAPY